MTNIPHDPDTPAYDVYVDLADALLEHAEAIARLDANSVDADTYAANVAGHVNAMRLLAVAHVDPQPERGLVRQLRARSGDHPGVYVHLVDGAVQLVIDAVRRQHKVTLWTRQQIARDEDDDA